MHDPLTVAFTIRRPFPRRETWTSGLRSEAERRWRAGWQANWRIAGRTYHWPLLVTVWHRDPSGYDSTTCWPHKAWRLHIHHWRLQIHPFQQARRRLLTRCTICGGRSTKAHPINLGTWNGQRAPWYRGEANMRHMDCVGVSIADR